MVAVASVAMARPLHRPPEPGPAVRPPQTPPPRAVRRTPTGGGNGLAGGIGTVNAIATNSGVGTINVNASSIGGAGGAGNGLGFAGANGTAGSLGNVTGSSGGGGTVNVSATQTGGAGGNGMAGATGGNGADSTLTNAVSGSTTGTLNFTQSAIGGAAAATRRPQVPRRESPAMRPRFSRSRKTVSLHLPRPATPPAEPVGWPAAVSPPAAQAATAPRQVTLLPTAMCPPQHQASVEMAAAGSVATVPPRLPSSGPEPSAAACAVSATAAATGGAGGTATGGGNGLAGVLPRQLPLAQCRPGRRQRHCQYGRGRRRQRQRRRLFRRQWGSAFPRHCYRLVRRRRNRHRHGERNRRCRRLTTNAATAGNVPVRPSTMRSAEPPPER